MVRRERPERTRATLGQAWEKTKNQDLGPKDPTLPLQDPWGHRTPAGGRNRSARWRRHVVVDIARQQSRSLWEPPHTRNMRFRTPCHSHPSENLMRRSYYALASILVLAPAAHAAPATINANLS